MKIKEKRLKTLWMLFWNMFVLSGCTFGGGFVIVSLMRKKFVTDLKWLDEDEMLDITAIAQSSPGPIIVNAAVILGYRMCGVAGSVTAVIGTALPPMIIITVISVFYTAFRENRVIARALAVMRAGVAAVMFDVVIGLASNVFRTKKALYITLMILAFAAVYFFNASALLVLAICLAAGIGDLIAARKRKDGGEN